MIQRAVCPFEITGWEPEEYDSRDGITLTRTRVGKTFSGDLTGQSTAELLMASTPSGSAIYVGIERLSGSLQGRTGSFVLAHDANMSSEGQSLTLTIMRDSGTGDLRGIHGTGTITIAADGAHTLTLDYNLD